MKKQPLIVAMLVATILGPQIAAAQFYPIDDWWPDVVAVSDPIDTTAHDDDCSFYDDLGGTVGFAMEAQDTYDDLYAELESCSEELDYAIFLYRLMTASVGEDLGYAESGRCRPTRLLNFASAPRLGGWRCDDNCLTQLRAVEFYISEVEENLADCWRAYDDVLSYYDDLLEDCIPGFLANSSTVDNFLDQSLRGQDAIDDIYSSCEPTTMQACCGL